MGQQSNQNELRGAFLLSSRRATLQYFYEFPYFWRNVETFVEPNSFLSSENWLASDEITST